MGRSKGREVANVEAQAVGLPSTPDGSRGRSSHDRESPRSLPRHRRGGKVQQAQEKPSRRNSKSSQTVLQSPGQDDDDINSTLVMPPPSQRRLDRSATEPLEELRRYATHDVDPEGDRLALVRRYSDQLEAPTHARRLEHRSPSVTDSRSDSEEHSDVSEESEESLRPPNALDLSDVVEEADDEAPTHRRRRSDGKGATKRRAPVETTPRQADSIRLHRDNSISSQRELVLIGGKSRGEDLDNEREPASRSQSRHHQRAGRASEPSRPRHASRRAPKRVASSKAVPDPPQSQRASTVTSSRSSTASVRRPTNVLSGFFTPPAHSRKHSKPITPGSGRHDAPARSERVECIICMSDVSIRKSAHLKCDHHMCHGCLKRAFHLSVEDSAHMPPRCCTKDHIPPRHVERLLDLHFKKMWNRKFVEYTTKNRLYCPAKRCGHFIKPSKIKTESGRKYARCGHCDTKVCAKCNNRWHKTAKCPSDDTMNEFLAQAKEAGWQRCYQCKAMVELREGCNHMTCRCGAEFCIVCGTKWKNCDCPWFSDEAIAADRLAHGEVPAGNLQHAQGHLGYAAQDEGQYLLHPQQRGNPAYGFVQNYSGSYPPGYPATAYAPQHQVDFSARSGRDDADLARRMDAYGTLHDEHVHGAYGTQGNAHARSIAAPQQQAHYHQTNGQYAIDAAVGPLQAPYDRAAVADYVSDVSRARGTREDSMERRLADRLAERPSINLPSGYMGGGSAMAPLPPGPPMYPGINATTAGAVDPTTGLPILLPGYPYAAAPGSMDPRFSGMMQYAGPSQVVMWDYECYGPRGVEANTPRRRRRAQERERAAEARRTSTTSTPSEVKSSSLAGLTGPGRGMDRVAEWSSHVAPGVPASTVSDDR